MASTASSSLSTLKRKLVEEDMILDASLDGPLKKPEVDIV
jgi:hypothetical protein